MTKATRIINKYHIKEMLLNGNPQFENFYKEELIQFCEVSRELIQELKKQLEVGEEQYNDLVEEKEKLQEQLSSITLQFENQQKEFIEYLEKNINHYKEIIKSDRENNTEQDCRRFETRWTTYEEILSKYKEIIETNINVDERGDDKKWKQEHIK